MTDNKTEYSSLQYILTDSAQAEIFMEIAWMYYGQGKGFSYNEKQLWEFFKGWERGTYVVVASDHVMQVTFFMLIGSEHQYEQQNVQIFSQWCNCASVKNKSNISFVNKVKIKQLNNFSILCWK